MMCGGVGRSGSPIAMLMTSTPFARSAARFRSRSANRYGGMPRIRRAISIRPSSAQASHRDHSTDSPGDHLLGIVAPIQPVGAGIPPKPGKLPLGAPPGVAPENRPGLLEAHYALADGSLLLRLQ